MVCRVLKISESKLYYRRKHALKSRFTDEERKRVVDMFYRHMGNFGRRVLNKKLAEEGFHISEHKISEILKSEGLYSKHGRRKATNLHTDEKTAEKYICENLYRCLGEEDKKKEIWSMDFTEMKIGDKVIYTCGIISIRTRCLVGRITGCRNNSEAACSTLMKAVEKFGVPFMILTDRGSPFTSKLFTDMINSLGIVHSMSRPHTPVDNRFIETFWKTMKIEIGIVKHLSIEQYEMIMEYYEYYYNFERPHSSLEYCSPMHYLSQNVA